MSSSALYQKIQELSPQVYWVMNESSGDAIQQGSSTAGNLVLSGGFQRSDVELIPNDTTKFITLSGGKGTASRGNIALPLRSFSISMIVKLSSTSINTFSSFFSLMGSGETEVTNAQFLFRFINYPVVEVLSEYSSGDDIRSEIGNMLYPLYDSLQTSPKLITIVKDSEARTITSYVNGYLRSAISYSLEPTGGTSSSFFVGGTSAVIPAETLPMTVGHVAFFQRALTRQEVTEIAKSAGFMPINYTVPASEYSVIGASDLTSDIINPTNNKLLNIADDDLITGNAYIEIPDRYTIIPN
jgi:hypothetical protein